MFVAAKEITERNSLIVKRWSDICALSSRLGWEVVGWAYDGWFGSGVDMPGFRGT
jgi:hypothetical protein